MSPQRVAAADKGPLGQFAVGHEDDRDGVAGELRGEGIRSAAQERGGDVGVDDDEGSREGGASGGVQVGQEGLVLIVGLERVDGCGQLSTDLIGRTPCRRASSSVGTKSSADQSSGCSGVVVTSGRFIVPPALYRVIPVP